LYKDQSTLRRYTIGVDGFASLHAKHKTGDLITKCLVYTGNKLTINFSTTVAGSVFIELQDETGLPIPGYSLNDCDKLFGDDPVRIVTWKDKSDLSHLIGKPVYVHVTMREADLYSLRFQE
jgi:hypothetical protein